MPPVLQDFLPKLKQHILPRVLSKLQLEEQYNTQAQGLGGDGGSLQPIAMAGTAS